RRPIQKHGNAGGSGSNERRTEQGEREMNRFVKVLLAVVLGPISAGLWNGNASVVGAAEPATLKGHSNEVLSVAYSPDSKTLASASDDKTVKLWDVATGKEQATLKGHAKEVTSVAFSPDGKTLASGSLDQSIELWDVATGKEQTSLKGRTNGVAS